MFWEFLSAHHLQPVDILESRSVVFHCKISRELKYQMVFRSAIYSLLKFWRVVFGDILLSRFSRKLILKNFFAVRRLQLSCTAMLSLYSPHLFLQVCCSVLHCVAVWFRVSAMRWRFSTPLLLQAWCGVVQCVAACCSVLQHVGNAQPIPPPFILVGVLHCVAACCSVLQRVPFCQQCTACSAHLYSCWCVAVSCSMLQCLVKSCTVLQCVVACSLLSAMHSPSSPSLFLLVCCSVVRYVAVCCIVLQCVAVCCSVLQCVAVCCSMLQYVAVCCSVLW